MSESAKWADYLKGRRDAFVRHLNDSLKTLLEQKHLYQSVILNSVAFKMQITKTKEGEQKVEPITNISGFTDGPWVLTVRPGADALVFTAPDVRLYCATCDRREPFNFVDVEEMFQRLRSDFKTRKNEVDQLFALSYQCQGCKGTPEVLLLRRRGDRLTIEGRSPMEHVEVPRVIPKRLHRFFRGAVIAHQSGETLPANFMLRTMLEQWARFASGSRKEQADQIMDDYMNTLPEDFKKRFPSVRILYGDLSVDIHTATGSADLFESARQQIEKHFDARRLFELQEPAAEDGRPGAGS